MKRLGENDSIRGLDVGLLAATLALLLIGLLAVFSATHGDHSPDIQQKFGKQVLWCMIGIIALAGATVTPLQFFYKQAYWLYGVTIVALLAVLMLDSEGPNRWLAIGPLWIQPAEFAKIGTVLALARYLSHDSRNLRLARDVVIAFALSLIPFFLILRQPDLGTALIFVILILPVLHWSGLSGTILFVLIAPFIVMISSFSYYSFLPVMLFIMGVLFLSQKGVRFFLVNFVLNIGVGIMTPVLWKLLQDYQRNRILAFLGMVSDPQGSGYQVIQSKVAIGSGGLAGKGFLQGTQTHLRFLPEQHTDFIFSVIGEEFGFLGAGLVLLLFLYIVFKGFTIASQAKRRFAGLTAFGITIILFAQSVTNIAITVGMLPVTGLPLPFLSYGGSSLVVNMLMIGLLLNFTRKRFEYV